MDMYPLYLILFVCGAAFAVQFFLKYRKEYAETLIQNPKIDVRTDLGAADLARQGDAPVDCMLGSPVDVRMSGTFRRASELRRATLSYTAYELTRTELNRPGKSEFIEDEWVIGTKTEPANGHAPSYSAGAPFQIHAALALPRDLPPSFHAEHNRIGWRLNLRLEFPYGVAWTKSIDLNVRGVKPAHG